ncbi:MAG TPA: hypothetical protein VMV75_05610 [Sulfuricella sp.]|nr:hypothetical protein [Sulfuricella sp.]
MNESVFFKLEFFLLLACSIVIPIAIYIFLLRKRAISRRTILLFAVILIALSAADIFLLQSLAALAKTTLSTFDDKVFSSELSIALYLLPAVFAGIGLNLVSHVLIDHLDKAERKFAYEHPDSHPEQQ